MSNKSNSKKLQPQAKSAATLRRLIKASKKTILETKNRKVYAKAKKRLRDLELQLTLENVKGKGIYDPKNNDITKYKATKLRKLSKEFGDLFDPSKYVFIKAPKAVRGRAQGLDLKATKTGLFVPKNGNKNIKLKKDKTRDEYYIERSGKTKWGINKGKRYRSVTPIASIDELEKEKDRIKDMADKLGPLNGDERLSFVIIEKGNEGYSHATFTNIDLLFDYLDNYRKTIAAKLQFYRHIEIVKTESVKRWFSDHPVKAPKKFSRRLHTKGRN